MVSSYDDKNIDTEGLAKQLPLELGVLLTRYVDPFVGNGKMFSLLMSGYGVEEAVICDRDSEIINVYRQIKKNPEALIQDLKELEYKFNFGSWEDRQNLYKANLSRYSYIKGAPGQKFALLRATTCIFLSCTRKILGNSFRDVLSPDYIPQPAEICNEEKINTTSLQLQVTKIIHGDFNECLPYVNNRTFMYVNPKPPFSANDLKAVESFNKIARYKGAEVLFDYSGQNAENKKHKGQTCKQNHTRI